MWRVITLWDFWLLQDGRKPKIYIALKLALQTHRRKIYCELLRGKISPSCQVDTSPLLMKAIAKDHSLFSAYSYTLPSSSVTGLCQREDREPVEPPWSVSVQLLPYINYIYNAGSLFQPAPVSVKTDCCLHSKWPAGMVIPKKPVLWLP